MGQRQCLIQNVMSLLVLQQGTWGDPGSIFCLQSSIIGFIPKLHYNLSLITFMGYDSILQFIVGISKKASVPPSGTRSFFH